VQVVEQGNGRIRINSSFLANPSEVFNAADFDSIEIYLFAGNDSFIIPTRFSIPITIDAGADQTTPPANNGQPKKSNRPNRTKSRRTATTPVRTTSPAAATETGSWPTSRATEIETKNSTKNWTHSSLPMNCWHQS